MRKNEAQVEKISNIGSKRDGAGSNYMSPKPKMARTRATKGMNCGVVERKDSHLSCTSQERSHYATQMTELCGNTQAPALLYKGKTIPRRVLSDYSFMTKGG